jgi:hypothetical protein
MNKWQIICPVVLLVAVAFVILLMVHRQEALDGRAMAANAVTRQLDGHSPAIATLLATMKTNDISSIEDTVYVELQRAPSSSLITRSDIQVMRVSNGSVECVIDMSRWGVSPRTIR